jgi:hypothetical protein
VPRPTTLLTKANVPVLFQTLSLVEPSLRHKYRGVDSSITRAESLGQDQSAGTWQIEKWLSQAREARSLASAFQSIEARRQMLSIASAYERLAQFAREREG